MRLTRKQKLLLRLLHARGEDMSRIGFHKFLFFLTRKEIERGEKPSYDFLPYYMGGYSLTADMEWDVLVENGFLQDAPKREWVLNPHMALPPVDRKDMLLVDEVANELETCDDDEMVLRMYLQYPEMAVRSRIAEKVLKDYPEAIARIEPYKPRWDENEPLFSIGYEGLTLEDFYNRLYRQGVTMLCDVRRVPFSHKRGFCKNQLSRLSSDAGISYKHFPELGIASHRRRHLETQEDYDVLFEEYEREDMPGMQETLEKLAKHIEKGHRIALMCCEALPQQCHRTRLVRRLSEMIGCPYRDLAGPQIQLCQKLLKF